MKDIQDWLAELMKEGAGNPPSRVTVRAVRRQRARRRAVAPIWAAAAIAVVAAVTTGLLGRSGVPSPAASPTVSASPVPCVTGWSAAAVAAPAGDYQDRLVAVAGSASDDIWAAGDRSLDPSHAFPLLEHWNGHQWAYSAGASLGGRQAFLTDVAVLASNDAWAVGNFASVGARPPAPLVEHWNGQSWSLQPTAALARLKVALPQILTSVVALAAGDVWVLGHPGPGSSDAYLHWNGTSWKLFPGPDISPSFGSAAMQVIGADRLGHLWAVGGTIRGNGEAGIPGDGIVERWNGSRWVVSVPAAWRKPLTMVAPVSQDDVWAITGGSFTSVGTYGISPVQMLHWDGTSWKPALTLGGTIPAEVTGLAAVSASNVYVTGQDASTKQPFIKHWDGTSWKNVPLGPVSHLRLAGSSGSQNPSLAVASDGSIVALDSGVVTSPKNFLWLACQQ
ncbi:MAG TPA: hypothetical protein VFQ44_28505 [Streptosporangiaceae bacterium]|nr:hypothetical protein [Streptosporangiaceae bacterium]